MNHVLSPGDLQHLGALSLLRAHPRLPELLSVVRRNHEAALDGATVSERLKVSAEAWGLLRELLEGESA